MRDLLRAIAKPEYVFRPRQLGARLTRALTGAKGGLREVVLPWGAPIEIDAAENIGKAIWTLGLYELVTSEVLWRLAEPGALVADIGANLGQMTSLLSARVGPGGRVVSFEPHPRVAERLERAAARWVGGGFAPIEVRRVALAEAPGRARLEEPTGMDGNQGLARLSAEGGIDVALSTLELEFAEGRAPSLVKLDVEGAEPRVLAGAARLLERRAIRDVLFEEHRPFPNESTQRLEAAGYRVQRIARGFWGPRLVDPASARSRDELWEPTNYLATIDPERVERRLSGRGWDVLRARR